MLQRYRTRVQVGLHREGDSSYSGPTPQSLGVCAAFFCDQARSNWHPLTSATQFHCPKLYKGLHVKPRLHAWQSQAISQSFRGFITFRSMRDTTFFLFFEVLFLYKITVSFTMVIKRSPGGEFAGGGRPPSKSTCAFPAWLHWAIGQHPVCPNRARRELWPRKCFLSGRNPWR